MLGNRQFQQIRDADQHALRDPSLPGTLAIALAATGCSSSPSKSSPDGGDASTFNVPWDWVGIVGTGQSLSVGGNAAAVTATQQPYNNLKLSFGGATVAPPFDPTIASLAVVPLVEPIRPLATSYPSAYPDNIYGETPHTAMADQITAMAMAAASRDYVTVHTVVGRVGPAADRHREESDRLAHDGDVGAGLRTRPCSRRRPSPGWRRRRGRPTASAPSS